MRDFHKDLAKTSVGVNVEQPLTEWLNQWQAGDEKAKNDLFETIYKDLYHLARKQLMAESAPTLQTTVLVHEAFIRLSKQHSKWQSRAQFFFVAAKVMRRILVDWARERLASKRGSGQEKQSIDTDLAGPESEWETLAVDQALNELEKIDQQLAKLVELRFFAGFSMTEISELTQTSPSNLKKAWSTARAYIYRHIQTRSKA